MASTRDKNPSSPKHTDTAWSSSANAALIERINYLTIDGAQRHDGEFVSSDELQDDEDIFKLMAPRVGSSTTISDSSAATISDSSTASRVTGPKEGRTLMSEVEKGEFSNKNAKKPVLAAANSRPSSIVQKRDTNDNNRGQSVLKRGLPESLLEQENTKRLKTGDRSENEQEGKRRAGKK